METNFDKKLNYEQMLQNLIVDTQTHLKLNEFGNAYISIQNLLTLLPKDIRQICLKKLELVDNSKFDIKNKNTMFNFYNISLLVIKDEMEESGLLYGTKISINSGV